MSQLLVAATIGYATFLVTSNVIMNIAPLEAREDPLLLTMLVHLPLLLSFFATAYFASL